MFTFLLRRTSAISIALPVMVPTFHDTTLSRPTCFFNRAHRSWRGSPRSFVSPLGRVWTASPTGDALAFIVVELKDIILLWLTFTLGCPSWQQPSSFLVLGLGPVNGGAPGIDAAIVYFTSESSPFHLRIHVMGYFKSKIPETQYL